MGHQQSKGGYQHNTSDHFVTTEHCNTVSHSHDGDIGNTNMDFTSDPTPQSQYDAEWHKANKDVNERVVLNNRRPEPKKETHITEPKDQGYGSINIEDLVDDVATMNFEYEDDDASSDRAVSERLVDTEGLTKQFNQWFQKSRKIINSEYGSRDLSAWEDLRPQSMSSSAEVGIQLPRVPLDSHQHSGTRVKEIDVPIIVDKTHSDCQRRTLKTSTEGNTMVIKAEDHEQLEHDMSHHQRPSEPEQLHAIEKGSAINPLFLEELLPRGSPKGSPVVIRHKHDKWFEKRALPSEYRSSGDEDRMDHFHQPDVKQEDKPQAAARVHFDSRVLIAEPTTGFDSIRSSVLSDVSDMTLKSTATSGTGFDPPVDMPKTLERRSLKLKHTLWEPEPDYDMDDNDADVRRGQSSPNKKIFHETFASYMDDAANLSSVQKVQLIGDYEPTNFVDKIPEKDTTGRPIPPWKRQLIARQLAEKAFKEDEEKHRLDQVEAKYRDMPLWKRALLQRKEIGDRS